MNIFSMQRQHPILDVLNGDDAIDLLADLCAHWKRHRETGYTPKSVRAGILLQCNEINARDLNIRSMEDRIKELEQTRVNQASEIHELRQHLSELRKQTEKKRGIKS